MSEVIILENFAVERFYNNSEKYFSLVIWIKIDGKYLGRNLYYYTLVEILRQIKHTLRSKTIQIYCPCPNDDYLNYDMEHFNGKCPLCKRQFILFAHEHQKFIDFIDIEHCIYQSWSNIHPSFINRYYYMADVGSIPRTFLSFYYKYITRFKGFSLSLMFNLNLKGSKMEEMDVTALEEFPSEEDRIKDYINKNFDRFKLETEEIFKKVSSYVGLRWVKLGSEYGCIMTILDNDRIEEARREVLEGFNRQGVNIAAIGFDNNGIYLFPE